MVECKDMFIEKADSLGLVNVLSDKFAGWVAQKGQSVSVACPIPGCTEVFSLRYGLTQHLFLRIIGGGTDDTCARKLMAMLFDTGSTTPGKDLVFYCPWAGCTNSWTG